MLVPQTEIPFPLNGNDQCKDSFLYTESHKANTAGQIIHKKFNNRLQTLQFLSQVCFIKL